MIDVSWRAVVVGIVTSLMVLPPNALIVLIFRRSKAKNPGIIDEPGSVLITQTFFRKTFNKRQEMNHFI